MSDLADYISDDLRHLTSLLAQKGEDTIGGILGGDDGYGADYENDVFEMHKFWWGDCECGWDDLDTAWDNAHPHADDCYQSELERRGGYKACEALAAEWGLPRIGCAVHCTCGRDKQYAAWQEKHPHPAHCPMVRPNFRHKASGAEVRWYQWIGRSTEVERVDSRSQWRRIIAECEASL